MSKNPIPFVSREQFEAGKPYHEPDPLFPIHEYDICKRIWENSPLIIAMCEDLVKGLPVTPAARLPGSYRPGDRGDGSVW